MKYSIWTTPPSAHEEKKIICDKNYYLLCYSLTLVLYLNSQEPSDLFAILNKLNTAENDCMIWNADLRDC